MNTRLLRLVVALIALTAVVGCKKEPRPGNVVGTWATEDNGSTYELIFNDDNTWSMTSSNPTAFSGSSVSVSGTYTVDGAKVAYRPLESEASGGSMTPQQAAMIKKQVLKPETNTIDFKTDDEFVETAPDGRTMVYRRVPPEE